MKNTIVLILLLVIVGCAVPVVIENPPGSGNLTTNYAPNPGLTNAVGVVGAVNDATAGINPWHGLITIILGATTGIAGWIAKRKNDQVKSLTGKSP